MRENKTEFLPFRNLHLGIIQILKLIFEEGKYTDREIEKSFRQNKLWGSRDRGFVAETVYNCVRWKRLIDYASDNSLKRKDYWAFLATWIIINDGKIPDLDEYRELRINEDKIKKNYRNAHKFPAIEHSVSDAFKALGLQQLPDRFWKEIQIMNQQAPAIIRTNTLINSRKDLQQKLKDERIETHILENYPDALVLKERKDVFKTNTFKLGGFEMQDASSQKVALFCDVKPGMRVGDSCAGAGGKTLHLAALMENKGQIIAMDIFEWKLKELKRRAKRAQAQNIQTKLIESNKTIKRLKNSFDVLLIDVPCTGSGIISRNPDAKYKIDASFSQRVRNEQKEILNMHSTMVKNGGILVYATCSIFPNENNEQVDIFLKENKNFQFIEDEMIWPSETKYDGFYMAKMKKLN